MQLILEYTIGFFDISQRETVCDERSGIYLTLLYQTEYFLTVTAVYTTGLEREIFDENDEPKYPEDSEEYKRYAKFDRLWSVMFYIGDMFGIA